MRLLGEGFERGIGVLGRVLSKSELDHAARLAMRSDGVLLNIVTEADGIMAKAGGPCFHSARKMKTKFGQKLNHLKERYPSIRKAADGGVDDAMAAARFRVSQGNARIGAPVGQHGGRSLYYDDGPVTWIFDENGLFQSMRNNKWSEELERWIAK